MAGTHGVGGPSIPAEDEIVARAVSGSAQALEEILALYEPWLRRFVARRLRCEADAADCLQDVRLRLARGITRFRVGEPFGPWLRTIAANAVRNHAARRRRPAPLPDEVVDPSPGVPDLLVRAEDLALVGRALASLGERERLVLLYRLRRGWRHGKIARALGTTEGAARVAFCRALAALRAAVKEGR